MRTVLYLASIAFGGCWAAPAQPSAPRAPGLVVSQHGVGPLTASTTATLLALRDALPELRVTPRNDPNLELDIYDGATLIASVVPDDDGHVFNISVTSESIPVEGKPWRAGRTFQQSHVINMCECWGQKPVCYRTGEHVAVAFDRSCLDETDARSLRALDGLVIQRVIWSSPSFGEEDRD